MWKKLVDALAPFTTIARELRILRQLYELDLGSRDPPVIRITQRPTRGDTEVSYMGVEDKPKSALRQMMEDLENAQEDES